MSLLQPAVYNAFMLSALPPRNAATAAHWSSVAERSLQLITDAEVWGVVWVWVGGWVVVVGGGHERRRAGWAPVRQRPGATLGCWCAREAHAFPVRQAPCLGTMLTSAGGDGGG